MTRPLTYYRTAAIQSLNIAYREAGDPTSPKLVLLHGFPASSHQYRDLIPALATRFHVIAPDYPGFGNSDIPDPASFAYTFDKLSEVTEAFLKRPQARLSGSWSNSGPSVKGWPRCSALLVRQL